jgi:hypothetical protein
MESIIRNIIVACISLLFLAWLNKSAKKSKRKEDDLGRMIFTLTPIYKWVGIVCSIIFIVIGILFMISEPENWFYIFVFFILIFGGGSLFLVYTSKKIYFEMDNEEIQFKGSITSHTKLKWEEITDIKFSGWSSSIVFQNKKGIKVRAHAHLVGINEIIEMIEKKKGLTKKDIKFPY